MGCGRGQSSTIPCIGPPAEMEDDERPALNGGGGGGGGQKRKGEGQEEDPRFLQIESSRRLVMLESIVCILKCFNSVLRFHVRTDGDMGFRWETGSLDEQRIAGLIMGHVCSYILLYHLEQKIPVDDDLIGGGDPSPFDEGEALPDGSEIDDLLWGVDCLDLTFTQPLMNARRALVDGLRQSIGNVGTMEVSSTFDVLRDYTEGRRKQELMDVLHTLEVIGHARGYSPPEDDEEILLYKEIRRQITYYILHVHARTEFTGASGEKPCDYPTLSDPFTRPPEPQALRFIPPMHQLEVSIEQMPEHLSLLKECKQRVAHFLSSCPTPLPDRVRDLDAIMQAKDAARSALLRWKPMKASFVKPRSDCLDGIIDILGRIIPFRDQTPTDEEARLYSQIGEHVRSSLWLSYSVKFTQRQDKSSCDVYFANVSADHDHSSLSMSDARGKHVCTREQLLQQIMAYLRAFKSSCLDDVPSLEEGKKYHAIWRMLYPGLLVCFRSRPLPPHGDEEPEEIPGSELPMLRRKLCYVYKRVLCFLEEVREELCSMAAVVHCALWPEEQLSPEGALDWFMACKDDGASKAKEFVDRSLSLGRMSDLDHALLMLAEVDGMGLFFYRLSDGVNFVERAWHDAKKCAMVTSEVDNALKIICSEKPFVK